MCVAWDHTPTRLITLGRTGGTQPLPNGHRGALPWDIPYCQVNLNTLRTLLMLPWRNAITHVMEYTMLYWNSRGASTGNGTAAFEAVSLSDHT